MQCGGVILGGDRGIGHGEQGFVVLWVVDQQVEAIHPDIRIVLHKGQVLVDLADRDTGSAAALVHFHQFDTGVGVAGQAHRQPFRGFPGGHQLHQHIGTGGEHVAGDMGVITGYIVALGRGHVLHGAGLEVKLAYLDIGRQGIVAHGLEEGQLLVVTEQAIHDRAGQARLDAGAMGGVSRHSAV